MIYTFDKKTKHYNKFFTSVIPCGNEKENNNFNCSLLNELSYEKEDYNNMSIDEIREYIANYYNDVLSKLDPESLIRELKYSALVSDERSDSLALRHIVSEWLSIYTDEKIVETSVDEEGNFVEIERPKFIRPMLEEIIRNSKEDMKGFKSLRALYLFEKSEELEYSANLLEEETSNNFNHLREAACYLRSEAQLVEESYNEREYEESYYERRKYKRLKNYIKW